MGKLLHFLLAALYGIFLNSSHNPITKLLLFADFLGLSVRVIFAVVIASRLKQGSYYLFSFKQRIFFDNIVTFFYLFIETYCIEIYQKRTGLKTYVDLGANIGTSTLWYSFFNPEMKAYAFEPLSSNYEVLLKNYKINKLKVKTEKVALADHNGKADFYHIQDSIQNLDSGLSLNQDLPHTVETVTVKRFSDVIASIGEISLITMDIEGGEYAVLTDLIKTKKIRCIKEILFEAHLFNREQQKQFNTVGKQLRKIGTLTTYRQGKHTSMNLWRRA